MKSMALLAALLLGGSMGCRSSSKSAQHSASKAAPEIQENLLRYKVPLHDKELSLGGKEPLVTIVLFSNYACTPCKRTWDVMRHLLEVYGDKLRVVHRSVNIKGYAANDTAVDASLAAHAQGKFWDMHWRLFDHAHDLSRPVLKAHAKALGLDEARFAEDLDTGAFTARRLRDQRAQELLGVSAGPISFVNGVLVVGYRSEKAWHELVDHELAVARKAIKDGALPKNMYAELQKGAVQSPIRLEGATRKDLPEAKAKPKLPGEDKPLISPDSGKRYAVRGKRQWGTGSKDAPVLVVEFTDFQCPYCRQAHKERFAALRERYGDKLRWETRSLPLPIHPAAQGAAQAAWAAGQQGRYWDYHDALLQGPMRLGQRRFKEIAKELGLDLERFEKDQGSKDAVAAVNHDKAFAAALGVNATPTIFVNGRYLPGFRSLATYKSLIDEELQAAKASKRKGADFLAQRLEDAVGIPEFPNSWPAHISPKPEANAP